MKVDIYQAIQDAAKRRGLDEPVLLPAGSGKQVATSSRRKKARSYLRTSARFSRNSSK